MNVSYACIRMHLQPVFDTLTKDQNLHAKPDQNPIKNKRKKSRNPE